MHSRRNRHVLYQFELPDHSYWYGFDLVWLDFRFHTNILFKTATNGSWLSWLLLTLLCTWTILKSCQKLELSFESWHPQRKYIRNCFIWAWFDWWLIAAQPDVNDILFKEILVQDHFYREIFFITSFFELDNCLPLLRMNNVTTRNMSLTVSRGWAWGYVSAEYSAKYTAFECLSIYGFVISMIALFNISVLRNLFFIFLIIIWLPLSTFWRRSKVK